MGRRGEGTGEATETFPAAAWQGHLRAVPSGSLLGQAERLEPQGCGSEPQRTGGCKVLEASDEPSSSSA